MTEPRFANVSCSQCGQDFGPGNHGYSSCSSHREVYVCPYCGEEMPSGEQPESWAHCGEAGHAERYEGSNG